MKSFPDYQAFVVVIISPHILCGIVEHTDRENWRQGSFQTG